MRPLLALAFVALAAGTAAAGWDADRDSHAHAHEARAHHDATAEHEAHEEHHAAHAASVAEAPALAAATPPSVAAAPSAGVEPLVGAGALAAGAGLLALAAAKGAWIPRVLRRVGAVVVALPLFTRLPRDRVLDAEVRRRVHAIVAAFPGVHVEEVARRARVARGTAVYHLRRLEKAGLVTSVAEGRLRRWTVVGVRATAAPLSTPNGRALADAVRDGPGREQVALARALGLPRNVAQWHLARLEAAGVVRAVREGGRVRYWPSAA